MTFWDYAFWFVVIVAGSVAWQTYEERRRRRERKIRELENDVARLKAASKE